MRSKHGTATAAATASVASNKDALASVYQIGDQVNFTKQQNRKTINKDTKIADVSVVKQNGAALSVMWQSVLMKKKQKKNIL